MAVTLDDLNNDPTLLAGLTSKEAFDLYNEAETTAAALAGSLFQQLYAASADAIAANAAGTTEQA